MRYLVFGDVHGNLTALDAVLAAGQSRDVQGYFFVGDAVGYGPNPIECIDRLHNLKQHGLLAWVAGNHELAVRREVDMAGYSAEAVATLQWTRQLLEAAPWALRFVEQGELVVHVNEEVYLTHDSLVDPSSGRYHRCANLAVNELYSLAEKKGRVAFYGHTHSLRAEFLDAQNVLLVPVEPHTGEGRDPHPLHLEGLRASWIGVGSVGFPTNKERWPECLIFDADARTIEKYLVSYARAEAKAHTRATLTPVCGAAVANRIARWL